MPQRQSFGPLDGAENDIPPILLSVDEFESVSYTHLTLPTTSRV